MLGQFYIAEAQKIFREDESQTEWQPPLFVAGLPEKKKKNTPQNQQNKTRAKTPQSDDYKFIFALGSFLGRE